MKTTIQLQQEKAVISAKLKLQLSNLQLQQTVVTQLLPKTSTVETTKIYN